MKLYRKYALRQPAGFILPVLLITGVMIVLMITAVTGELITAKNVSSHNFYATEAQLAADAGLDAALNDLNTGGSGAISQTPLLTDTDRNIKTTYEVVVTPGTDDNHKTLTVTGKTYSPAAASTASVTRKYVTDIEAVTSGTGPTSLASGVGGLVLNGNSKITGGDVVVNGKITMANNSQIGLSTNPVNVRVADQACPAPSAPDFDTTYPRVCDSTLGDTISDPIVMGGRAVIYGDVQAKNQSTGTNMFSPGLKPCALNSCDPQDLPPFDRTGFTETVGAAGNPTMTGDEASNCTGGIVNWPANVKISGNVTTPNNCTIQLNGNAWITGSFKPGNNGKIAVQDPLGTTMPDIVVDGSDGITLSNNVSVVPNSSATGVEMLTFWSAAACSPDCTEVTGADLYNSQSTTTITLSNNGGAANSVLYAYWSKAVIANNGNIGAVAGQTVELENNAIINFTSSISGSDNRITTWVKRGYMRVYN